MYLRRITLGCLSVLAASCSRPRTDLGALLVQAAEIHDLPTVQKLLDAGADPEATVERPWPVGGRAGPALRFAAAAGNDAMVRALTDRGADPDVAEALHTAAKYGHRDTVRLLLERGANPARKDANGHTAFVAAIVAGQIDIAADLAKREAPGVLVAALSGDADQVAEHTGSLDAPGIPGLSLLHVAALAGQAAVVRSLLDRGAALEAGCDVGGPWLGSPLVLAARAGRTTTVRLLLDRGADPNQSVEQRSVLVTAARAGHAEVVRLLIERGAAVDREQDVQPALCAAAVEGHVEAITALLDLGAAVDRPNARGRPPLRLAAGNAHLAAMELLIARGATVDPNWAAEVRSMRFPTAAPDRLEQVVRLLERRGR